MSENLYEILGVKPDATAAQLKRAYRREAKKHHPDKAGGDETKFSAAARAYRILTDPGSRLLYDTTGTAERPQVETEIQNILLRAFQDALATNAADPLTHSRTHIQKQQADLNANLHEAAKAKKDIAARRKRVKAKKADVVNLFHLIIDKELEGIDRAVADIKYRQGVYVKCLEALDLYEADEMPQPKIITLDQLSRAQQLPPGFEYFKFGQR